MLLHSTFFTSSHNIGYSLFCIYMKKYISTFNLFIFSVLLYSIHKGIFQIIFSEKKMCSQLWIPDYDDDCSFLPLFLRNVCQC